MIIAWEPFELHGGARRVEAQALGREASRRAFAAAARAWQVVHGAAPWATAGIVHDSEGAPILSSPGAPFVSITHGRGLAGCAIGAPGTRWVGVDAECTLAPGMRAVRELAERSGEAALDWPDAEWPSRLWCAKEAVVKAERSAADLLGRTLRAVRVHLPTSDAPCALRDSGSGFAEVVAVTVVSHHGRAFVVHTARRGAFTVAAVHEEAPSRGEGAGAKPV